jgi:hypothetical protein
MDLERQPANRDDRPEQNEQQSAYVPPTIVSYTSEEILEQVGPAQACSPSPCGIF